MIEIDKNVPLPKDAKGNQSQFPWRDMAVGDSFFAPKGHRKSHTFRSPYVWSKESGWEFLTRSVTENNVDGWRVWRTK